MEIKKNIMITISLNLLILIIIVVYCTLIQILNIWYRHIDWEAYSATAGAVFWVITIITIAILSVALFSSDLSNLLI